jgi:hypothetical protein
LLLSRVTSNPNTSFSLYPARRGGGFRICSDSPNIEVSGEKKKDKAAKVATARNLWVPAVNNHGGLGRWAFVEISDPWDAEGTIRAAARGGAGAASPSAAAVL